MDYTYNIIPSCSRLSRASGCIFFRFSTFIIPLLCVSSSYTFSPVVLRRVECTTCVLCVVFCTIHYIGLWLVVCRHIGIFDLVRNGKNFHRRLENIRVKKGEVGFSGPEWYRK